MTVAEHLHFAGDLNDLMRSMPHRQFLMWQERIKRGWNRPDRSDHYLMSLAQKVVNIMGGKASLDDMRIEFKFHEAKVDQFTPTLEQAAMSEGAWMAAMGVTNDRDRG